MNLDDVAVVVTTFIRPKELMTCVASIRKFYPDIKIMVADNGRPHAEQAKFMRNMHCEHLLLPFDSGLAMTRNKALDRLSEYPYIIMTEDDMEFTEESSIEKFKAVIEAHPEIGVVAGGLELDCGTKNLFANEIYVDKSKNMYKVKKIDSPEWHNTGGVRWYYADYVYNFHIMRNAPDIRWDAELKQCIEHFDFAVHMKIETDWLVAATPDIVCKHHVADESAEYVKHRRNFETWKTFFKKRGVRFLESDSEKTMRDFQTVEKLSYPEYIYRMIRTMNEAQSGVDMIDRSLYRDIN